MRQNTQIEGIKKMALYTYKTLLYTDDIVFTIQKLLVSFVELNNELVNLERYLVTE